VAEESKTVRDGITGNTLSTREQLVPLGIKVADLSQENYAAGYAYMCSSDNDNGLAQQRENGHRGVAVSSGLMPEGFEGVNNAAALSAALVYPIGVRCHVHSHRGLPLGLGTVRYAGCVSGHGDDGAPVTPGIAVGVELDKRVGKNNGTVLGHKFFTCDDGHGIFVNPAQVRLVDGEEARSPTRNSSVSSEASLNDNNDVAARSGAPAQVQRLPSDAAQVPSSTEANDDGDVMRVYDPSGCAHGVHRAAHVLLRALPGTGKTWLTIQLLNSIAHREGSSTASRYVPYLLEVKRLAFVIRNETRGGSLPRAVEADPVEWYVCRQP